MSSAAGNAAVGVAFQIFLVVIVFVMSIFTGMGVLVARFADTESAIAIYDELLTAEIDGSLQRLQTDRVDLYYMHRFDPKVPVADMAGAMGELIAAGKIGSYGVSEWSAAHIREAHAVTPMAAVQTEYSLWTRNPEIAVLQACQDIGAAFVAFSPVARGFLCGAPIDVNQLDAKDIRRSMPRFNAENFAANQKLLPPYHALAHEAACSPAQLALAWLLHQGEDIIPIPGTTSVAHLQDNLAAVDVQLNADQMSRLEALINQNTVAGDRYNAQADDSQWKVGPRGLGEGKWATGTLLAERTREWLARTDRHVVVRPVIDLTTHCPGGPAAGHTGHDPYVPTTLTAERVSIGSDEPFFLPNLTRFVEFVERGETGSDQVHVLAERLLAPLVDATVDGRCPARWSFGTAVG